MRLFRMRVLKTFVIAAVVAIEFAVVNALPVFWMILAFALAAVALACHLWTPEHKRLSARSRAAVEIDRAPAGRLLRVRFTVRRVMIGVALVAIILWPFHLWLYKPYYDSRARFHGFMAALCEAEAQLMMQRADQCLARGGRAWDDPSEEADVLKICPYPSDGPRYGSWLEQGAVWQRAAAKSRKAARWHSLRSDDYASWNLFEPRDD